MEVGNHQGNTPAWTPGRKRPVCFLESRLKPAGYPSNRMASTAGDRAAVWHGEAVPFRGLSLEQSDHFARISQEGPAGAMKTPSEFARRSEPILPAGRSALPHGAVDARNTMPKR